MFLLSPIFVSFLIFFLSWLFINLKDTQESLSKIFECGYDVFFFCRLGFSLRVYMLTLVYLIFDSEIVLLIPMIYMMVGVNFFFLFLLLAVVFVLVLGLMFELKWSSIEWLF